ncbi:MAG TPA: four-carbon acid sugar kinase family protein [Ktedonobacteraceae bacterium]|nr:four-carbon acid sugar kinase family protein [Ktedonobacteraceae bacterium]
MTELIAHLPPEPDEAGLFGEIQQAVAMSKQKLVVIDDDPTGTQTVHGIELLTTWNTQMLTEVLQRGNRLFYLLTNARSMPEGDAMQINRETAHQLVTTSQATNIDFVIASRSDSTLRGHYPAEIFALAEALTASTGKHFDGHLIVPAFFEGGRYTINNTHYVATPIASSNVLQPAHETPFAQDSVFGFKTAYLPAWVEEKSKGYWKADQVLSIGLERIRQGGPEEVAAKLMTVEGNQPIIINAAGYGDLAVVVLGLLQAEKAGKRFLYRTAASFVRLRGAVELKPLLSVDEILGDARTGEVGGLVVVGSYVPGSGAQLESLLTLPNVTGIELPVERVVRSADESQAVSREVGQQLDATIKTGRVGVLYTSRTLTAGTNHSENLAIGRKVSHALVSALHEVTSRPRFIIAKGGITSHDVAQKGLGAARAYVPGQLFPGVPVWKLESGPQSKFEHIPYVVFPGNVGSSDSLMQAVKLLSAD